MLKKNKLLIFVSIILLIGVSQADTQCCRRSVSGVPTVNTSPTDIEVGKGPDAMFLTPDKQKLFIANVGDTMISVINTRTNLVIKTINAIRYPWGFSQLGQTNEIAVSAYDNQLAVINFVGDEIVRQHEFDTPLGGLVTSRDGKFIFVVGIEAELVFKLDAQTFSVIDSYQTGKGPDGIGISENEKNLFVTNTQDGNISVINVQTKEIRLLETGGKPELVHNNHSRSLLYISNFIENRIHVIDANNGTIIHEIEGLNGPEEAVPSEDEKRLYVVNFNDSHVYVYDTNGYIKMDNEYLTGAKPIGVMPIDNHLYVTNYADNSVSVITLDQD